MAREMPRPGHVLAGKYAIVRVIGEGGMGVVYEASHMRLRQRFAIKMLLPTMLEHDVIVQRFEREARAAAGLKGRHAAHVVDVDQTPDGLPYMVMEYLEGHDLQQEIERRGGLPPAEAVDYVLQACAGVLEAHQLGIIHRDLKPSNLFLVNEDGARIVKLLDFGISKMQAETDTKLTETDVMMGTALYMSPEQIRASHDVDGRTDIWALGVILYESLAGRAPFVGSPTQVAAAIVTQDAPDILGLCAVPPDLASVLRRAMQRDRDRRFPTVRDFALALGPFANPGTPGRIFADSLVTSSPRVSLSVQGSPGPSTTPVDADTQISSRGVSEMGVRPADGGTAPGWSQGGVRARRSRAALYGFLATFVVALALALTVVLVRARTLRPPEEPAIAAAPTEGPPPIPPASASEASAPLASVTPPPPVESVESAAPPKPPPVVKRRPPPAAAPPPKQPPPKQSPPKPAVSNPLVL